MYKQCRTCNSQVPLDAKFCQTCGNSDFIVPNQQAPYMNNPVNNQPNYNYGQNSYGQANTGNQTRWQPATPQEDGKKKKNGLIVGVVVAVVLVLAGIGYAAQEAWQDIDEVLTEPNYSEDIVINDDITSDIEYTKGTFDGKVYENEWADIRFELPEGFHNADAELYSSTENHTTDCGAYFLADDSTSLFYICYEKLPGYSTVDTEEEYLDIALSNLKTASDYTYIIPSTYSAANLAGYEYLRVECEMNNGYQDLVDTIYVRKLDDYIIFISVISIKGECDNDKLMRNVINIKAY